MTFIDVIWWVGGGILAFAGFVFAVRALFWDRSRGRKRCPKCWYDLSGGKSNRCPECGYETQQERKLFKTRRRWRRALLGMLIIIIVLGAISGREVYRVGWIKATPTIGYIIFLPMLDSNTAYDELFSRVWDGELYQWESSLLVNRLIGILESDAEKELLKADIHLLQAIAIGINSFHTKEPWASKADASKVNIDESINALINLFGHSDKKIRLQAIKALGHFREAAIPEIPVLLGQMASDDKEVQQEAWSILGFLHNPSNDVLTNASISHIRTFPLNGLFTNNDMVFFKAIGETYGNPKQTIELFLKGLKHQSDNIRAVSVYCLALLAADRKDVRDAILKLNKDSNYVVRETVLAMTSVMPFEESVKEVIAIDLLDDNDEIAMLTLRLLSFRATDASNFKDKVLQVITEGLRTRRNPILVSKAASTLVAIGGDPQIAVQALLEITQRNSRSDQADALKELALLDYESEYACKTIRPLLDSAFPEIQAKAAFAYAMLGGDTDLATNVLWKGIVNPQQFAQYGIPMVKLANAGRMSVQVTIKKLNSPNATNRVRAAGLLSSVGWKASDALPDLRRLLTDSNPRVVKAAKYAIKRIEWAIDHPESEDE